MSVIRQECAKIYCIHTVMHPQWYLLNYIAPALRRREALMQAIDRINATTPEAPPVTPFLPEVVEAVESPDDRSIRLVGRPLLYHYIFLYGTLDAVKQLAATLPGLSFVINRSATDPAHRYLTLSEESLRNFRIIARRYANRLPYCAPDDALLIQGDEVEVVSGDFAGLRGIFIARRGSSDGNIIVRANRQIGSIAYDIRAEQIRVLRFAKDSRRAYDQIDAFVPRLLEANALYEADRPLTPSLSSSLQIFTRRYSATEIPGAKFDAKVQALLWRAHTILGNDTEAAAARARYQRRAPAVTNPRTLTLLHQIGIRNEE